MNILEMKLQLEANKIKIESLEKLIEHQSEAYVKGYYQASVDNGILLKDINLLNLDEKYRASLYNKALKQYPKID